MANIRDMLTRAFRARDAGELKELEKEWEKDDGKTGDDGTGEPGTTPSGESLHVHIHNEGGSAGAGGSSESARPAADSRGKDAMPGMTRFGDQDIEALQQSVQQLQQLCQQLQQEHQQIMQMLNGGGEGAGATEGDGGMYGDNAPEEKFSEDPNKEIKTGFGAEAPPGASGAETQGSRDRRQITGRPAVRARDSAHLEQRWQDVLSMAEIIVPGVRAPTFDRAAQAMQTLDAMCRFQRGVIGQAYTADESLRPTIDALVGEPYSSNVRMTCDSVAATFRGLAVMQRDRNNAALSGGGGYRPANPYEEARGIAQLNQKMRKRSDEVWGTGLAP